MTEGQIILLGAASVPLSFWILFSLGRFFDKRPPETRRTWGDGKL